MNSSRLRRRGAFVVLAVLALATSLALTQPANAVSGHGPAAAAAPLTKQEIRHLIGQRSWHPRASKITFSGYFEPDGRVNLMFDEADADVATALKERLGERLVLRAGDSRLFSGGRTSDNTPHFGGAQVAPELAGGKCSTSFSIVLPDATRASLTAGHCFNGFFGLTSGAFNYGFTDPSAATLGEFPIYDMIAIRPLPGHTFTNRIYTDPGSPITRTVIGARTPLVGEQVCTSGAVTKAKCDATVLSTEGIFCQQQSPQGCASETNDLLVFAKPGTVMAFLGDSGGPVYTRSGSSGATANGMIVGGDVLFDAVGNPIPKPGGLVYAEKISNILANFNARVLVSP
ncbi:hypothetical protein ACGFIY_33355 [Micromonospora chersina]|uniref:hypothetical protein n=1 Tax=Micromonospora chersina TaxID=47854 RepID=UPI0037219780